VSVCIVGAVTPVVIFTARRTNAPPSGNDGGAFWLRRV
jgi:hypothetical protein